MSTNGEVFLPWGVVTADFWDAPARAHTPPPPAQLPHTPLPPLPPPESPGQVDVPGRIAAIAALAEEGNLDEAVLLAEQLDADHAAAANGSASAGTATTDIREVRGYLASLTGDHRAAIGWYLHALRLRAGLHGPDHPDTEAAVHRTCGLWRTIPDPDLSHRLGEELLGTIVSIQGPSSATARRIRAALDQAADP
ncbi:hypothetical protein [Streptomyces sp. NPDC007369]|uniref:hypothetical protein n=1 Tax=Streptomyces sp. NPDC007369 TaxID=3154589 RepID=UPI0033CE6E4B